MDVANFGIILAAITICAVIAFALASRAKVKSRMANEDAPKSTLASDKRSDGKPADA
ncbi:hypothetical protein [Litoreibacter roseus]|uniref:Uncharacterized protein n=1 Tax=Litoreibacter roseus TaxID=2601869 RepID=A0A6N6JJF0_9RHOB|nr:hypothetical protein [Litoreibacter roseus]GFE65960.1 hypothetical protein KIN_30340 [Litoreibacter roseus]